MPEIRVQDEQGNIHVFPDGSTPEMIARAMNVRPPTAGRPDFAANPPGVARPQVNMQPSPWARNYESTPYVTPKANAPLPGVSEGAGLAEGLGEWIQAGPGQTVAGYRDLAAGNTVRGQRKLIAGAGSTLIPTLPFLAAAAPVATAATMATGAAGQYAGEKAASALGANPEQAGLAGDITSLAAGYAGAKLPSFLRGVGAGVSAPLGDTVIKPRGTIPAESATPAELKAYADQYGIPVNSAQVTEHNLPRNLMSAGERATIGGTQVRQQIKASQAAVAQHAENLLDSFSPNTPDLATAGDSLKQNVSAALDREMMNSRQAYAGIDQQAGGVRVDLQPLKQTAQRILADSDILRKSGLDPRRATGLLQGILDAPNSATFSQAQQVRSALLDASRSPELAISNTSQGWIKQLTGATDDAMMMAAKGKPGLEAAFRGANDNWTQLQNDFNNPRSPLAQILQEPDPSKVPQKLTQRGQIGGSPYNAQLLDRYGIAKGPVKWAVMNDLLNKDFKLYNKSLGGYGDNFLQSLFAPDELGHVYKTGALARSVGLNANPSGTAAVSGAMADVQKPVRSLAPKAGAAKLTKSPGFNNWMMRPGAPPATSNRAPSFLLPFLQGGRPGRKEQ